MILVNELMGRIVAHLRRRWGLSQRAFARALDWPQGLVSKVERGDVSITWDQIDAIAGVLTEVAEARRGPDHAIGWASWELFHLGDLIADELEDEGYRLIWKTERLIRNPERYVRGAELDELVLQLWDPAYRDRL
ncbi:MAG: helix-turn-helix transcriptional regulator [Alphaproteobacteria bacterium]|nr:helix-turn-helix transcriptional regulator [Alphaproteobacteria bacterium]